MTHSRRSFLGGANTMCAVAATGVLGRAFVPSSAWAAEITRAGPVGSALAFEGQLAGKLTSASGGYPIVKLESLPEQPERQRTGITYEPLKIAFGRGMAPSVLAWVNATLAGQGTPKSGSLVFYDMMTSRQVQRVDFHQAVISEIALSALNARSPEPPQISLTLLPVSTQRVGPSGELMRFNTKDTTVSGSSFRVSIDGIPQEALRQTSRVEGIGAKFRWAGNPEESLTSSIERSNVIVSVPDAAAVPFYQWLDQVMAQQYVQPRAVGIDLVSPLTGAPVGTIGMQGVAIVSAASMYGAAMDTVPSCNATLVWDSLAINFG